MDPVHKRKPRRPLSNLIRQGSNNAMNVNLEQLQALTALFADAEAVVELYWDTGNGQRLSGSLERARMAFPRVSDQLHELTCSTRLVIEADCTTCGPMDDGADGLSTVRLAV